MTEAHADVADDQSFFVELFAFFLEDDVMGAQKIEGIDRFEADLVMGIAVITILFGELGF